MTRVDPLVGEYIDNKYRIEALIGSGGMGCIYRAEHIALKRTVAVKVLHPQLAADDTLSYRFLREARAASSLSHPNIVTVLDFGQEADTGRLYLVMELLEGCSLQELQELGPLDLRRALNLCRQILLAVDEAHIQGVVHRDLKPENTIVLPGRQDEVVKVVDFGLARLRGGTQELRLTSRGIICGTPAYLSPEQARAEEVGPASDIYSFGVILFEVATGRLPFTANSPYLLVQKHLGEAPPDPAAVAPERGIPSTLSEIVLRCLEKEPQARFGSAMQVHDALLPIIDGLPVQRHSVILRTRTGSGEVPIAGPGSRATLPTLESPITLIGRDGQLAAIESAGRQVMAGRGMAVVVRAAPGMGKSGFLLAAVGELQRRGMRSHLARAIGDGAGPGATGMLLRSLLACGRAAEEEVRRALEVRAPAGLDEIDRAALFAIMTGQDAGVILAPEVADAASKTALLRLLQIETARRPRALILDDADKVRGRDLALLTTIIKGSRGLPLLLVLGVGPDSRWSGTQPPDIELGALSAEESEALLAQLGVANGVHPAVTERIVALSEGSPLFLVEASRLLYGYAEPTSQGSDGLMMPSFPVPSGMRPLILARCDVLDVTAKKLLLHAAAISRTFSPQLLSRVTDEKSPQARLEALCEQGFLEQIGTAPSYRFCHEIVRGVIYERINEKVRQSVHDRIATALVRKGVQLTCPEEVGNQLELAGHHVEAAKLLETAGDQRLALREPAVAATLYSRAQRLLELVKDSDSDTDPGLQRAEIGIKLAQALNQAGQWTLARTHALAAHADALKRGASLRAACAVREFARAMAELKSDLGLAATLLAEAYEVAVAGGDARLAADLACDLGELRQRNGDAQKAVETLLTVCERLDNLPVGSKGELLNRLGRALLRAGQHDAALQQLESALAAARADGGGVLIGRVLGNLASAQAAGGDRAAALQSLLEAHTIAQQVGDRLAEAKVLHNLARLHFSVGEHQHAEALARESYILAFQLDWAEGIELGEAFLRGLNAGI